MKEKTKPAPSKKGKLYTCLQKHVTLKLTIKMIYQQAHFLSPVSQPEVLIIICVCLQYLHCLMWLKLKCCCFVEPEVIKDKDKPTPSKKGIAIIYSVLYVFIFSLFHDESFVYRAWDDQRKTQASNERYLHLFVRSILWGYSKSLLICLYIWFHHNSRSWSDQRES